MAYYLVEREDSALFTGFIVVVAIVGGICMCIQRLIEAVTPYFVFAGKWLISFHFNSVWECLFHFYVWLVYVPVLAIASVALGSLLFGAGGGIWGGYKLTSLMNFGEDWVALVLKIVIGFALCLAGLALGVVVCSYVIVAPAVMLLTLFWTGLMFVKDVCFRLKWMNDVFFAILIYGIIPGGLLTGLILNR